MHGLFYTARGERITRSLIQLGKNEIFKQPSFHRENIRTELGKSFNPASKTTGL
jgi:hypothetical protein